MFVLVLIVLLIDLLTFKGLVALLKRAERGIKIFLYCLHWLTPVALFGSLFILYKYGYANRSAATIYHFFVLGGLFLLFYIPKLV